MNPFWIILLILLLAASFFFSASETALVGLSRLRLRHLVQKGVHRAKELDQLIKHLDEVVTAILVGNNFVNAAASSIGAMICVTWLGPEWGILVATLLMGSTILLAGEITPKVLAIRHADRVGLAVTPLMRIVTKLFQPLVALFSAASKAMLRAAGVELRPRSPLVTEEELKIMIEVGKEQGVLGEEERLLLHRIFEFGDLKIEDVMIPREQMVVVHEGATHDEVLTILTEQGHARLPVTRGSVDRIVGVIYAQELLHIWREGWLIILQDLIHPVHKVPPNQRVIDLLKDFQRLKIQIAVVVDKEDRALGLVTLEDLMEEIVGEIEERSQG